MYSLCSWLQQSSRLNSYHPLIIWNAIRSLMMWSDVADTLVVTIIHFQLLLSSGEFVCCMFLIWIQRLMSLLYMANPFGVGVFVGPGPFRLVAWCFGDETQVLLGDLRVVLFWWCVLLFVMICHLLVSAKWAAYRFFTAYVVIRTVPQSIYGQTRGKKKLVGFLFALCVLFVFLFGFCFLVWADKTSGWLVYAPLSNPQRGIQCMHLCNRSLSTTMCDDLARATEAQDGKKNPVFEKNQIFSSREHETSYFTTFRGVFHCVFHCCFTTFRGALQRFVARYKVFAPFAHCDALFCTALRAQIVGRPSSVRYRNMPFTSKVHSTTLYILGPHHLWACPPCSQPCGHNSNFQTRRFLRSQTKEEENESTRKWPTFSWGHLALQRQRRRLFQPSPLPRQVASSPR